MTTQVTHPPKEVVRAYLAARKRNESPPATPDDIRRQLGWRLLPTNGAVPEVRD
jgi:hypothetical protein